MNFYPTIYDCGSEGNSYVLNQKHTFLPNLDKLSLVVPASEAEPLISPFNGNELIATIRGNSSKTLRSDCIDFFKPITEAELTFGESSEVPRRNSFPMKEHFNIVDYGKNNLLSLLLFIIIIILIVYLIFKNKKKLNY